MHASTNHQGYNNSNNVGFIPLKQGEYMPTEMNSNKIDIENIMGVSRNANSPLPAVPLPAKKNGTRRMQMGSHSLSNQAKQSASCDNLSQISPIKINESNGQRLNLARAASVDFDMFGKIIAVTQPLLAEHNFQGYPQISNAGILCETDSGARFAPSHDYEELQEHQRRIQTLQRQTTEQHPATVSSYSPQQSVFSTNAAECLKQYPRERQNPMYSGMRAVSPFSNTTEVLSNKEQSKSSVISNKCACALIAGFVVAIVISVVSFLLVSLLFVGVVTPMKVTGNENEAEFKALDTTVEDLNEQVQSQSKLTNRLLTEYNASIAKINEQLELVKMNKSVVRINEIQRQLQVILQSLTPNEIVAIFGNLSGSALSRCRHETYSVGGSTSQAGISIGDFYADEGFVITGATCSSSETNYIGSLQTSDEELGGINGTSYKCLCRRNTEASTPVSGRVYCRIDYWQCPTSLA